MEKVIPQTQSGISQEEIDFCLNCILSMCDDTDKKCHFIEDRKVKSAKWYEKIKDDPVRYAKRRTQINALRRKNKWK